MMRNTNNNSKNSSNNSSASKIQMPHREGETGAVGNNAVALKPYEAPILISYGDVRDITLGPTIGGGESGCAAIFRNGPGGCPSP